jgi:hypothetical protein
VVDPMARRRIGRRGTARYLGAARMGLVVLATVRGNAGSICNAAGGGAGRRPATGADAPMNQSREAHHAARPLHSPEGGQSAAVFAADWPHEGGLTSTDALGQRRQGYATPARRE